MTTDTKGGYRKAAPDNISERGLRIIKGTASIEDRFVPVHDELVRLIAYLRSSGCVIGFVTGVWDLFHIGHAEYIQHGKDEVSRLYPKANHIIMVVGVDTDAFTKQRKGPKRPIVPEGERVRVLGHLRAVDILTLQYEADQLFRVVEHDARVISQSTQDLPGLAMIQEQCEHIVNLPPQAETSTTARIRQLSMDGSLETIKRVRARLVNVLEEISNELGT